ncbi:MAG: family 20 glycosylhydrolase [Bacteroidota bacterium]
MKRSIIKTAILWPATLLILLAGVVLCQDRSTTSPLVIFHLDLNSVSLRKDYIEQWLRKASAMGYNAVLWEVEGKVKWETCPESVSPDAFSKEQFRELLAYSRQLGLEPIPLLQTLGHAEYVLQQSPYVTFRERADRYDCYCTSNQEVRKFLTKWIAEYCNLFGEIRYFHLGGDEAYVFGTCKECSPAVAKQGANKFLAEYLRDIASQLLEARIRPCIWGDMIMKNPDDIDAIPKDFVIWDWNYWDTGATPSSSMVWSLSKRLNKSSIPPGVKRSIPEILDSNGDLRSFYVCDFLDQKGFDVVACSSSRSHGDGVFAGRHKVHAGNVIEGSRKCAQLGLLGSCVTSWAVRLSNYETQEPWLWLAPLTVSRPGISDDSLLSLVSSKLFGVQGTEFFDAISDIGYAFPFASENSTGILWTGMKDMRPAPKGYLKTLIEKWKSEGTWEARRKKVLRADSIVTSGTQRLQKFLVRATRGYDVMYQWSLTAHYQLWQAAIAQAVVRLADSTDRAKDDELVTQVQTLKTKYIRWAEDWMNPASARQSGGMIYDAISDYLQP